MDPAATRLLWQRLETLNAVTYFAPECRQAPAALGLKGFWMGYFACRAAPLGAVPAGVVEATFYNFHPDRVRRAIPDAWSLADPAAVLATRSEAAASALRRLLGDGSAEDLAAAVSGPLSEVAASAGAEGRPLFAANRDGAPPADPVAALWQVATTLREHRGDGHVALLAGAGLDGCEVHVLFAGTEGVPATLFERSRGWSPDDWAAATERLRTRGLIDGDGTSATAAGSALKDQIERRTDELAAAPYGVLGDGVSALLERLEGPARTVASAGEIFYPNPMGLPPLPQS